MSPTTKAVVVPVVVLGGLTAALMAVVVWQLHGYSQSDTRGWGLAFNILTARASPFGTRAGVWAVILAVWGFLMVPAVAGAVAALILGAYITGSQATLDRLLDIRAKRVKAKLDIATQKLKTAEAKKETREQEKLAKQAETEQAPTQASPEDPRPPATGVANPVRDERDHD